MAQQLKKAKCVVHVANHGADALLFLQTTTFAKTCPPNATPLSIVLMDLEMPIMDGLTCVRKIRECQRAGNLTRPVPVIAVSRLFTLEIQTMLSNLLTQYRSLRTRGVSRLLRHRRRAW